MAHDLRTPLNNLYGVVSLLKESELSEEKSAKLFELAEKEHKQGISLMEDMLASFSLENTEEARKESVNISEFLEEFAQKTLPKTKQNQLVFKSSILPNITANIYPFRFQRVIENLISNAIKFTPTKGQINLMLHKEEHQFIVVVADSGIGIPKNMQPHLFKKFNKQIKRQGLKGEKTNGLGLSIVKQIVEQHEGHIYIDSEEGKGTAITLKIPL